jgi:type I restriction enzyme S subunit
MNVTMHPRIVSRKIRWQTFGLSGLDRLSIRLDASAYCTADKAALGDTPTIALSDLADVRQPTIFGKKEMQGTPSRGVPLFSSSEMLLQSPEPNYFISRRFEPKVKRLLGVREGTILVSRSGTTGLVTVVTADRDGFLVDDHMIRIIPKDESELGIIFTFLSSLIGQQLLDSLAYGAVQKEIKAFQLENIRVPRLSARPTAQIASNINNANRLRTEASLIYESAIMNVLHSNRLPPLVEERPRPTFNGRPVNAFTCAFSTISGNSSENAEIRLEAHFHNPIARAAAASLKRSPSRKRSVGEVTESVFFCNRFSRTFVEEKHGIPYLVGKNIVQIRPQIERCLSITETQELEAYKLYSGWTLVTCSGTIGRTCFVWNNFEKYVATHDLIRVVADKNEVDPAYLYAFLSCPYGYEQIQRFRYGSVVDHVTPEQVAKVIVPLPSPTAQKDIGDEVRIAYEKRAEALKLEAEAQDILMREINGQNSNTVSRQHV